MTKAGNKDIIITEQPKPRAIIKGQDLKTRTMMLKSLFVGEHADFYAAQAAKNIAASTEVIGVSIRDCFEMALQKPSLYVGELADYYMGLELDTEGFTTRVLSTEDFDKLLAGMTANKMP